MLTIRDEQMEALALPVLKNFEDEMVEHIKEFFPNHFRIIGAFQIRNVVRYGIERAKTYGFTTQRNVSLYITLMPFLGSNFDIDDIQLPWTKKILYDKNIKNPSARIDKLADRAIAFSDEIAGKDNIHLNRVLIKLHKKFDDILS